MVAYKNLKSLLLLLLFFDCSSSTKTVLENQSASSLAGADIETLVAKFKEISSDTFKVISSLDYNEETYRFKGVILDSAEIKLLPKEIVKNNQHDKNFYACYKFQMDNQHTGLIIRTPSMYTPSSLKLFVMDNSEKKILETYIELAETVVQLVEYWDKKTFIVKDKTSATTFLIWEHQNEDTTEIFYTIRFRNERFDTLSVVTK
ncbi:MAG TPA: hypothetical protein VFE57_04825 [Cyclobacteriaceae bacterium]|jgi:hypothetical protein|nr:hypothetical protein [Cyclobacteriaceae bacterium]